MGQYDKKGTYAGYKKNSKEREELDYYATPTKEVENILEVEGIELGGTLLEPCCGGGHMLQGIVNYADNNNIIFNIMARDYKNRQPKDLVIQNTTNTIISYEFGQDFLSDEYPEDKYDYIVMNPPFSTIEPFCLRALELTKHKLIMFGRTKFIESVGRYKNIFLEYPPTRMYQYVDRIACAKGGDFTKISNSIEANAWFVWDLDDENFGKNTTTELHWIRRK